MNNECNNPLTNKIGKTIDTKLVIELMTHFVYQLQEKLGVKLSSSEMNSFIPIDQLSMSQLRMRLQLIDGKIDELIKKTNNTNKQSYVNELIKELKEDNYNIEREINELGK